MSDLQTISIDCVGGDGGPSVVLAGLASAIGYSEGVRYLLYGPYTQVKEQVSRHHIPEDLVEIVDVSGFQVDASMKPSFAIRNAMKSSMGMAIQAVKAGLANACISAGNTGAYMGLAKVILRMIPGVSRPAIATLIPGVSGPFVMLDLGANAECNVSNLVEFAIMGQAFARAAVQIEQPSVGILNIGSEENKGTSQVKEAYAILKKNPSVPNFVGFVEGDKLFAGDVNVVVSDGFCGNITLKVIEGSAKFILSQVKSSLTSSLASKLGALLIKDGLKNNLMKKIDPRLYNGAILLGVNGVVVKSHGGTDAVGFANAIKFTTNVVKNKLVENTTKIMEETNIDNAVGGFGSFNS